MGAGEVHLQSYKITSHNTVRSSQSQAARLVVVVVVVVRGGRGERGGSGSGGERELRTLCAPSGHNPVSSGGGREGLTESHTG